MQVYIDLWAKYSHVFINGLIGTLWIAAVIVLFGTMLGIVIAMFKMSKNKILNSIGRVYTHIIRCTPILLQLYFFWLWLPEIVPIELSETACIIVALIINSSSYISEIIRAGINAVDKGQWEAARSLGLSESNMFIRIIFPQAIKNILPALANQFVIMVKETSLASIFFVDELMTAYKTISSATYINIPSLVIVGIIYFIVLTVLSGGVSILERRLAKNG